MVLISPLKVPITKKKYFILNLNNYRNTHFFVLNKAKIVYKEMMQEQLSKLNKYKKIRIKYTLYPKTNHLTDIGNVTSIHQKLFEDALVETGLLEDDNYLFIIGSTQAFGEIDKDNPRVEIEIEEIDK